jgi:predicted alpha/beta hydrolase family esterase
MKKVYLIHGWEGSPTNNWFPYLKAQLKVKGFEVFVPSMPGEENPKRAEWEAVLEKLVPNPDQNTYFVGHSMGCRAILRYLENLPKVKKIGGAVLVAGWVNLPMWEGRTEAETKVIEDWINPPMNLEKIHSHCQKFVAIFSDNDIYTPKENIDAYKELGAEIIIKHAMGHFADDDRVKELPEVLEAIIEISKS